MAVEIHEFRQRIGEALMEKVSRERGRAFVRQLVSRMDEQGRLNGYQLNGALQVAGPHAAETLVNLASQNLLEAIGDEWGTWAVSQDALVLAGFSRTI